MSVPNTFFTTPPAVCEFYPFGEKARIVVSLTAWPSWWARLWFFVFFGWRFKAIKKNA